jgi:hypothetical protein
MSHGLEHAFCDLAASHDRSKVRLRRADKRLKQLMNKGMWFDCEGSSRPQYMTPMRIVIRKRQHLAAIKIQTNVRAWLGTKLAQLLRKVEKEATAATKLQSVARKMLSSLKVEER